MFVSFYLWGFSGLEYVCLFVGLLEWFGVFVYVFGWNLSCLCVCFFGGNFISGLTLCLCLFNSGSRISGLKFCLYLYSLGV